MNQPDQEIIITAIEIGVLYRDLERDRATVHVRDESTHAIVIQWIDGVWVPRRILHRRFNMPEFFKFVRDLGDSDSYFTEIKQTLGLI